MLSNHELKQKLSYLILGQRGGQSRVQIIEALKDRPYNINQIASMLNLNYRTVKHHIDMLLKHGLIGTSRTGGYGEVYFISPELEARMPMFHEISQKLKTITTSPRFFQNVIEQTNDAVVIIDDKLEVIFWNQSAAGLYGFSPEEAIGSRLPVFSDLEVLRGLLKLVQAGKKVVGLETQGRHKDGRTLDVDLTIDEIKDEENRLLGYSMISMDVTERKRAVEALALSESRYSLAQKAAGILSWEWDPATDVMGWSEKPSRLLGTSAGEPVASFKEFLKRVHPEDREAVGKTAADAARRGRTYSITHRILCPDDSIRWLAHTGGSVRRGKGETPRVLGVLEDITDRLDAERKHATMLETAMDGVVLCDRRGKILEVNDSYCAMVGYKKEQLLRKLIFELQTADTMSEVSRRLRQLKAQGRDRFETRNRRKDGTIIDVELSVTHSPIEDGRLIVFARDMTERKKAQARIDHMASFPRLNPSPVLELDLSGKVTYTNPNAERLLRETGRKDPSTLLPDDLPLVLKELVERPGSTIHRDVSVGDRKFRQSIFQPRGLSCYRIYSVDITERIRAEQALQREQGILSAIMDTTDLSLVYLDPDFNYVAVNPAYARTCRMTPERMVGKNHFDLYPDRENEQTFKRVRDTGKSATFHDKPFRFPDQPGRGVSYWDWSLAPVTDASGDVAGLVFSLIETTERVRSREQIAYQAGLLANVHDAIFATDADHKVTFWNRAAEDLFGWKAAEATGRRGSDLVLSRPGGATAAEVNESLRKTGRWEGEAVTQRKDGTAVPIEARSIALKDDRGKVTGHITISRDISERKRAQEALARAEKMAALGRLAGGAGHELSVPLTAIKNAAYYIRMALEAPVQDVADALDIMSREVGVSERIISNLLDLAGAKPVSFGQIDLLQLVGAAIGGAEIPPGVKLVRRDAGAVPPVTGDSGQLELLFHNLLRNAVEAMPGGGSLEVGIRPDDRGVAVSVRDTGKGIEEADLPRIFDPLFTTKARGIGLGLTVARTLAEAHGGKIEVKSRPGTGSTFTVFLPKSRNGGGAG